MHPFILPWRAHAIVALGVLMYTNDMRKVLLYVALILIARISMLFLVAIWKVCCFQLSSAKLLIANFYYITFQYAPGRIDAAAEKKTVVRDVRQHALIGSIVAFEGNIGAGKSTEVKLLEAGCEASRVHHEDVPLDLLQEFQRGNGVPLQMTLGTLRRASIATSVAALRANPLTTEVHDRWIIGDRAFAFVDIVLGKFDTQTINNYLSVAGGAMPTPLLRQADMPITLLYVPTLANVCKERIVRRNGPDRDTPLRYLLLVSLLHSIIFCSVAAQRIRKVKIHIFDASKKHKDKNACACRRLDEHVDASRAPAPSAPECMLHLTKDEHERLNSVRQMLGLRTDERQTLREDEWLRELYDAVYAY